jgi:adenosylcobinamide-GDP ribazoletransferase
MHLPRRAAIAVLVVTAGSLPLAGRTALWAMFTSAIVMLTLRAMMKRRLGGATGDTLGAGCEVVEAAALVAMALTG